MTGEGRAPPGVTQYMFGDCSRVSSRPSVTLRAAGLYGLCQRDLARRNAAHCMLCLESWVCEHTCAPAPFCSAVLAVHLAIPHSRSPGVPTTDGRLVAAFPNFRWHAPLALCAVSAVILATTGAFQGSHPSFCSFPIPLAPLSEGADGSMECRKSGRRGAAEFVVEWLLHAKWSCKRSSNASVWGSTCDQED